MSRKDYNAVAAMLYKLNSNIPGPPLDDYIYEFEDGYAKAVEDVMFNLAEIFARENERFETQRFLRACGV